MNFIAATNYKYATDCKLVMNCKVFYSFDSVFRLAIKMIKPQNHEIYSVFHLPTYEKKNQSHIRLIGKQLFFCGFVVSTFLQHF